MKAHSGSSDRTFRAIRSLRVAAARECALNCVSDQGVGTLTFLNALVTDIPSSTFLVLLIPSRATAGRTEAMGLRPPYMAELAMDRIEAAITTSCSMLEESWATESSSCC